ncbi:helix-turn-helix transcriptional regulator [[Clostridium] symbiosum]|uniref:helix-turn-helix transcriptional regulator n=1 Tax=Clostridium symbiosum TaxID=1512 RepID=UPI001D09076F|nr:helix-turn-helix transcriptional regulator [[Clostridium] symbiosum]MCB6608453.1 helix-turn-helix domain-containing protein [[Clostridium] symbiosum]MCB6930667.1 helix-turn-helix domain-containing protein [[Clostridium] symbiosum]
MRVKLSNFGKADWIKIIRESTGLNQAEFGKRIGKTKRSIIAYENGKSNYNSETLEMIYKEFKINFIAEHENSDNKWKNLRQ